MSRHSVSRCSTLWISDVQCFDARCSMLDLLGWCNHKQIDPTPTDPSAKSRLCYQYLIVLLWSGFSKYLISCFFLPNERVRSSQGSVRSADVTKEVWKKDLDHDTILLYKIQEHGISRCVVFRSNVAFRDCPQAAVKQNTNNETPNEKCLSQHGDLNPQIRPCENYPHSPKYRWVELWSLKRQRLWEDQRWKATYYKEVNEPKFALTIASRAMAIALRYM